MERTVLRQTTDHGPDICDHGGNVLEVGQETVGDSSGRMNA
jgi:hypothetical protein